MEHLTPLHRSVAVAALTHIALALPAHAQVSDAPVPAEQAEVRATQVVTIDRVVADFLFDLENGFRNAAHEHGRTGSGHFEDIVKADWLGPSFSLMVKVHEGEDWAEEIQRIEEVLSASPYFQGEGWTRRDGHLGAGETYSQQRPDGTSREVALGFMGEEGGGFVALYIGGDLAKYERDGIFLADIPREPGGTSSLMRTLGTDEGRSAFQRLLASAKDDFESITTFGPDGTLQLERSVLNPADSHLTFMEIVDLPERRDVHLYPAAGAEEGRHHLSAILWDDELDYRKYFTDDSWVSAGDCSFDGIGPYGHVTLGAVDNEDGKGSHWVISAVKAEMRDLHERLRLVPSETHPKVAAILGCASGDCENGFGELRYLDPTDHSRIRAYRGRFMDGRFHGHGADYEIGHKEWIIDFDRFLEPDQTEPDYIAYFRGGAPITVHMPLPDVKDQGLCELLHGYHDCKLWSDTLDQFDAKHDRYSISVFAARDGEKAAATHGFLQHQTFADGTTVVIDRPFTLDFGEPVRGTCRGEEGALRLPGIGVLEAGFDAQGVAQDHAFLTLLSGEIYEVRIKNGIPLDFERVAVPDGLSWKPHARRGLWAMLQRNTCLEGDCRAVGRSRSATKLDVGGTPFVWSAVRTQDGAMKSSPGYLTVRAPGADPADRRTSFTTYYNQGVEFERAKRREDPSYRLTDDDAWHYNVRYAHNYLYQENEFFGSLDGSYRLQGEYAYDQLNSPHYVSFATAYFRDDVRYLFDYKTRVDSLADPLNNVKVEESNGEMMAALVAEELRRRERREAAKAQRSSGSLFGSMTPQHIKEMNSIFARPAPQEGTGSSASICYTCGGLGAVSEPRRRTVRKTEETTLFFHSWNETETYYVPVTCPHCLGSGKR